MEENNMQSPKKVICCKLKDTEKLMARMLMRFGETFRKRE